MKGYKAVRDVYHGLVPEALRDQLYDWSPQRVKALKKRVVAAFERDAPHDHIYDRDYYQKFVEPTMQISARTMAGSIASDLHPTRLVDLGCGTGVLLAELRELKVEVIGLELADAAIAHCRERRLDVRKLDIERDAAVDVRSDVVVSTEVAEHLPASCADRFVDMLVSIAGTVVLTAATPSVSGTDHINEQPNEYWIEKFASRGLTFDRDLSMRWRADWRTAGVAECFWSSLMIFRRDWRPQPNVRLVKS